MTTHAVPPTVTLMTPEAPKLEPVMVAMSPPAVPVVDGEMAVNDGARYAKLTVDFAV